LHRRAASSVGRFNKIGEKLERKAKYILKKARKSYKEGKINKDVN